VTITQEMLAALTAERFGDPVRTDRPRVAGDIHEIVAEIASTPIPLRSGLGVDCQYAACSLEATGHMAGWAFCLPHLAKHHSEATG
jgi:hypothetical protein